MPLHHATTGTLPVSAYMGEIFAADATRQIAPILTAIHKCVLVYRISLQEIETELRKQRCWTYLIAHWPDRSEGRFPILVPFLQDGPFPYFYLVISTRDQNEAMAELRENSDTYDENFARLPQTGVISIDPNISLERQVDIKRVRPL